MPLVFIPDTIDGSEIDLGTVTSSKVRGGIVTGLTGSADTALEQILTAPGMPAFGSAVVVGSRTVYLRNIRASAISADAARVALIYDNNFGGGFESAYIIKTGSYLTPYTTNMVPRTRTPIRVSWTNPLDGADIVPADNITFTFQRPTREIQVSGVKVGTPPTDDHYEKYVGYVNSDTFKGFPAGYWLITGGGVELSRYKGFYSWNLTALTRNTIDWSETGILRSVQTGKYVNPPQSAIDAMNALDYSEGIISSATGTGIIRVGPYPTTAFAPLFGFSSTGFGSLTGGL